jgi:hypothetical protein
MLIDEIRWLTLLRLRLTSYVLAYFVALFCVIFINAVSFTLAGVGLAELSFGQWVSGAMNLGLVFAFWSELFIQQIYIPPRAATIEPPSPAGRKLVVEQGDSLVSLALEDIGAITAAGDYIEVHAGGRTYLDRNTLHAVEQALAGSSFLRVHRSRLVNRDHVEAVTPLSRGRYELRLRDGSTVSSSRGYRDTVEAEFLASIA